MNARLGDYVHARRELLGIAMKDIDGISDPLVRQVERGYGPPQHPKHRAALARGLGWTLDSFDMILAGGEPEVVDDPDGDELGVLEQRVGRLEGRVEELSRLVREFLTRRR